MKTLNCLILVVGGLLVGSAHATDTTYCVALTSNAGKNCGASDSLQIKVKNNCSTPVYVKMCLEKKDGRWSCGSDSKLKPGDTNSGFWACHATGEYKWMSCTGGYAECGFKNP